MSLHVYRKKRNFNITTEPAGKMGKPRKHLLYLIQKHAASHLHYDLRLEMNGVLKSWAVPKGPSLDPSVRRLAVHVEDHPISYGSFEGIIPASEYGGGTVMLWDQGEWICQDDNPIASYKKGNLTFFLTGKKLKGLWKLIRIKYDEKSWLLIKINDDYAKTEENYNILIKKPNSVKTLRTMDEITDNKKNKKKNNKNKIKKKDKKLIKQSLMPTNISPELAVLVNTPPQGKEWLHEIKLDGYRIIAFLKNKKVQLMTRNHNDWTNKFQYLSRAIKKLKVESAILDGELVALDEKKKSDFQLLQNSIQEEDASHLIYYIFDIIYYNGQDLRKTPLLERKKILETVMGMAFPIQYNSYFIGDGDKYFKKACRLSLEGIISKNIHSAYEEKRSKNWLKTKCIKRQEFVVVGFTRPKKTRNHFGSLLLAVNSENNILKYCGNVGTGFTEISLEVMSKLLKKYHTTESPLIAKPRMSITQITWVKPKIIIEVEFTEWTKEGFLRHPSFKGIRQDKLPKEILKEKAVVIPPNNNLSFHFTHLDKILYPKIKLTKLNLVKYYNAVATSMLPYVINRPLTIVRCPHGINNKCFYQKHLLDSKLSDLYHIDIQEKTAKRPYLYIKNKEGLLSLVQLNALEIHLWGCRIDNLEKPDFITFDLDPGEEVEWRKVIETAFFVKENLEALNLISFVKTTGGKGLHIVLPIYRQYTWDKVEVFAKIFVQYLVTLKPELYVATMSKTKRKGKIFLDYFRNQRGATVIAPYSTRAKENAAIAVPLAWDELTIKIKPDQFTIYNILNRLNKIKKDPWESFFEIKQKLKLPKI